MVKEVECGWVSLIHLVGGDTSTPHRVRGRQAQYSNHGVKKAHSGGKVSLLK